MGGTLICSPHIPHVIQNSWQSLCDLSHSGNYHANIKVKQFGFKLAPDIILINRLLTKHEGKEQHDLSYVMMQYKELCLVSSTVCIAGPKNI